MFQHLNAMCAMDERLSKRIHQLICFPEPTLHLLLQLSYNISATTDRHVHFVGVVVVVQIVGIRE